MADKAVCVHSVMEMHRLSLAGLHATQSLQMSRSCFPDMLDANKEKDDVTFFPQGLISTSSETKTNSILPYSFRIRSLKLNTFLPARIGNQNFHLKKTMLWKADLGPGCLKRNVEVTASRL